MSPKTIPKRTQEASRWPNMAFKTAAEISTKFRLHFGRFRGAQMGPQMDTKITQKSALEPQGRPEASREPFGRHLGAIWDNF